MASNWSKRSSTLVLAAMVLLGIQACSGDDPAAPASKAPRIPPQSTMSIDLSFFNPAQFDRALIRQGELPPVVQTGTGKDNFINAAVRALYIQLTFWAALEPPVSAFSLAVHSVPQPQEDGSWLWTYVFVDHQIEYSIFLYGLDAGDHTVWRMEVSTNNPDMPLDHFVWFSGEAMKDYSSGYWQFYEPAIALLNASAANPAQTPGLQSVRIDWLNQPGDIHQLTVLNNKKGAQDEGDNLVAYSSPAVSYLEFTDVSEPLVYNITWYPDGSGSIQVPDYNGGLKACWDVHQNDVVCPE
jgi:hypothetical protein